MERKNSKIYFEGVAAKEVAKKYGTPTYVYEASRIRDNYRRLNQAFISQLPRFKIFYAIKANSNPAIAALLIKEGAGLDCASGIELRLAQKLGRRGEEILFSGNNLDDEDLKAGFSSGAFMNLDDLSLLKRLLKFGKPPLLSFRINPGVGKSNVHESDVMAGNEAKFGIPWEKALAAYSQAKQAGVQRFGVHMMTGSCVTEPEYFSLITEKLLNEIGPIARELNITFEFVNIGGGFGIPYAPGEKSLDIQKTAEQVTKIFKSKVEKFQLGNPWLYVEPGRYLVGDAGFVIGQVHCIKESYKKFVGTDIGMNVLARPMIYGAYHGIYVDDREKETLQESVTICGQTCENADAWARDRKLPKIQEGDLIVVENAGAYGYVMSFPYNGRLRAAEVLLDNGTHRLIRRRETLDDWLALIPQTE